MIGGNEAEHSYECCHGPCHEEKTFDDRQEGALFKNDPNFTPVK